ncbi:Nkg2-D Type Ii Integral Membrane Protein [Manis pentadactyla]|nr:Nkg2-D Type Ii Integral Membrane Protein [Manis pentadactyla]
MRKNASLSMVHRHEGESIMKLVKTAPMGQQLSRLEVSSVFSVDRRSPQEQATLFVFDRLYFGALGASELEGERIQKLTIIENYQFWTNPSKYLEIVG